MKHWRKILLPIIILLLVLFGLHWINGWKLDTYTLSSGKQGGGYRAFAEAVVELSEKKKLGMKVVALDSAGSEQNVKRIIDRSADFALVQLGESREEKVRSVATVYRDVVHLLVRKDSPSQGLDTMAGKKVSIGLPSSGTHQLAELLLNHYDINKGDYTAIEKGPKESVKLLVAGEIDAIILVTALRAPSVVEAIGTGVIKHTKLVSNGDHVAKGIGSRFKYLEVGVLPKHAFAKTDTMSSAMPVEDIEVLQVPSQLVCHEDLSEKAVFEMTRSLYLHKKSLEEKVLSVHGMKETDIHSGYPLHEGAEAYYLRKAPGFLVVYAEVIALMMSIVIAVFGMLTAVRKWMEVRHKKRIDVYYRRLNAILLGLENRSFDDLNKTEEELNDIRHKAFEQLVSEQLPADESFRIFQDLLENCHEELERAKSQRKDKAILI